MDDKDKIAKLQKRIEELEDMRDREHGGDTPLSEAENLFRMVFENANDGIIIHERNGRIHEVNRTMYERLGYTREEMLEMSLQELVAPGFSKKIRERVGRLEQEGVAIFESADVRKDGTVLPVEVSARLIEYNGLRLIQSIVRDIHERKTAEALVQHALDEREILQEEIKSRVQVYHDLCISGLESLKQPGRTALSPDMLENQIRRIRALGFAQRRIYAASNVTQIDFAEIVSGLVKNLWTLYAVDARRIRCEVEIRDVFLDIHKATSCAQILIELAGNAFLHAFPGERKGTIRISIRRIEENGYALTVADDGIGIPPALDVHKTQTPGMKLVRDLLGRLGGTMTTDNGPGTRIVIHFP